MDDLQQLEAWAAPLLAKITPTERRALARKVGMQLRRNQSQRVDAQQNPDGSAFAPRKPPRAGAIKRRKAQLFQRITKAKHLKIEASADAVAVGFTGRVARIARVHQEGLSDRVSPRGPSVRYERRQILGFTDADTRMIRDLLIEHLAQ